MQLKGCYLIERDQRLGPRCSSWNLISHSVFSPTHLAVALPFRSKSDHLSSFTLLVSDVCLSFKHTHAHTDLHTWTHECTHRLSDSSLLKSVPPTVVNNFSGSICFFLIFIYTFCPIASPETHITHIDTEPPQNTATY